MLATIDNHYQIINIMAKWDVSRFLNTVSYFGAIPVLSDVQRWLKGTSTSQSTTDGERAVGVTLVIGAGGEIGQSVISQLIKSGYRVRAAIADLSLTPFSVPTNVEFVEAQFNSDRLDDDALTRLMAGVRAIIICPDPQNSVTATSLASLTAVARNYLPAHHQLELFDFTQPTLDLQANWGAVDDVVMGGVSESGIRLRSGYAVFSGNVSTDNSGGFASVRTRNFEPSLNLSNYRGIELRVKGDGQRYKLFVRTETKWDGIGYAHSFDTIIDEWMTIQIPFQDLVPIFRAKTVSEATPIDDTQIHSFQLMLSKFEYDRALNPNFTPGLFSLAIESISAYGGQTMPQLVAIDPTAISTLATEIQATGIPFSIVCGANLDTQMVAAIAVKSLSQPETVGQILGR